MALMMSAREISAAGPREPEAPVGASLAADQAAAAQLGQDRLEKLARDILRAGELIGRNVAAARGGEFDGGAQRVIGAGGQTHVKHYAGKRLRPAGGTRQLAPGDSSRAPHRPPARPPARVGHLLPAATCSVGYLLARRRSSGRSGLAGDARAGRPASPGSGTGRSRSQAAIVGGRPRMSAPLLVVRWEVASLDRAVLVLDGTSLTCGQVAAAARGQVRVKPGEQGTARARAAAEVAASVATGREVYGRTTGVGANRGLAVTADDAARHGLRLLRSHAGGSGPLIAAELGRAMLVVRANQIAAGGSGWIRASLTCSPIVSTAGCRCPFPFGAIGTGDLTALAAAALCLLGERAWRPRPVRPAEVRAGLGRRARVHLQQRRHPRRGGTGLP